MSIACPEWTWLMVVGTFAAVLYGFGTGSNDVANAFGTSVGAKTLTLRQATILAAIFEFGGALLLGRVSTNVIQAGIANLNTFQREPAVYAYGMICALAVGGIWQIYASYLELNVSATHSIIGAIIGFSLVYGGASAVNWATPAPNLFPPYSGVVPIVCSWIFAPFATAAASALIVFILRTLVLRRPNPAKWSLAVLPVAVFLTTWICIYFVFTRGAKKTLTDNNWDESRSLWVAALCGLGLALITAVFVLPWLWRKLNKQFDSQANAVEDGKDGAAVTVAKELAEQDAEPKGVFGKMVKALSYGTSVDIHEVIEEDELVASIHENAEQYDPKAEAAFAYLQVFSAICVIFSHGAGEVGYMTGPLGAVWQVYTTGKLARNIDPPIWMIIICAGSLVVGLATYGYNVTRAMGVRLAKLSPVRGFAAELATAMIIMVAAQYGLPTSSSQCITGGIVGVGLMEGAKGVNFKLFAKQFASWIGTILIMGLGTAALFSQAVYAPSVATGKAAIAYEDAILNMTNTMFRDFNTTLNNYKAAVEANQVPTLTKANWEAYYKAINDSTTKMRSLVQQQSVPGEYLGYLYQALALFQNNTVYTLGQANVTSSLYSTAQPICNTNVTGEAVKCPFPKFMSSAAIRSVKNVTALP